MPNPTNTQITRDWLQQNIEVDKNYIELKKAYNKDIIPFTLPIRISSESSQIKDNNEKNLKKTLVLTAEDKYLMYERCRDSKLSNEEETQLAMLLKKAMNNIMLYQVYELNNGGVYSIQDTKFRLEFEEDGTHYFKLIKLI